MAVDTGVSTVGRSPVSPATLEDPAAPPSRERLSGLDGLRAVAVTAVVVFHLRTSAATGGFLGVDLFFVISGFLITFLIIKEILRTGGFAIGGFYARRARRLLPTVLALLAVVTVATLAVFHDQLGTLKGGVLSSLGYVTNWWLIGDHQSYFQAAGRPSFFQHLWSLAIEEQFYIVWSVVVLLVAGRRRRSPVATRQRVCVVAGSAFVLAVLSTAVMAALAVHENLPFEADTSRVYFGSDTHSMGLFLGSAAGAIFALHRSRERQSLPSGATHAIDALGVACLVAVGYWLFHPDEFSPGLYRGGFLGFDAVVLVVILAAVHRGGWLGRVLDLPVPRWVGQRSYAIYIWHWPVIVVTRAGLDVVGPAWLIQTLRILVILGLADLSYRFVEVPLRAGQFGVGRWANSFRSSDDGKRFVLRATLLAALALLLISRPLHDLGSHRSVAARSPAPVITPQPTPTATASAGPATRPRSRAVPATRIPAPRRALRPALPAASNTVSVSAFGDSVLLGASTALRERVRTADIDSVEGRQAYKTLRDVQRYARAGRLQRYVVIHTGNNGVISADQLRTTLRMLSDRRRVVLVTDRVLRDWQDVNNATIRSVGSEFKNVTVVDWYAISAGHLDWFDRDGLHLTATGAANYAAVLVAALSK